MQRAVHRVAVSSKTTLTEYVQANVAFYFRKEVERRHESQSVWSRQLLLWNFDSIQSRQADGTSAVAGKHKRSRIEFPCWPRTVAIASCDASLLSSRKVA